MARPCPKYLCTLFPLSSLRDLSHRVFHRHVKGSHSSGLWILEYNPVFTWPWNLCTSVSNLKKMRTCPSSREETNHAISTAWKNTIMIPANEMISNASHSMKKTDSKGSETLDQHKSDQGLPGTEEVVMGKPTRGIVVHWIYSTSWLWQVHDCTCLWKLAKLHTKMDEFYSL